MNNEDAEDVEKCADESFASNGRKQRRRSVDLSD